MPFERAAALSPAPAANAQFAAAAAWFRALGHWEFTIREGWPVRERPTSRNQAASAPLGVSSLAMLALARHAAGPCRTAHHRLSRLV